MILIPYTGKKLPDVTAEGTRFTIEKPDALFGNLVAGYVYAKSLADALEFAKINVPDVCHVASKTEQWDKYDSVTLSSNGNK